MSALLLSFCIKRLSILLSGVALALLLSDGGRHWARGCNFLGIVKLKLSMRFQPFVNAPFVILSGVALAKMSPFRSLMSVGMAVEVTAFLGIIELKGAAITYCIVSLLFCLCVSTDNNSDCTFQHMRFLCVAQVLSSQAGLSRASYLFVSDNSTCLDALPAVCGTGLVLLALTLPMPFSHAFEAFG